MWRQEPSAALSSGSTAAASMSCSWMPPPKNPAAAAGNRQLPLRIVAGATPETTVLQEELHPPRTATSCRSWR